MPQRNLLIVLVAAVISYACYVRGEQNPYARFAASGLTTIDQNSLAPISRRELFDAAMEGMVGVLHKHGDEHSRFLDERETEAMMDDIHQQFGGIGVRIQFIDDPPKLLIVARPDANTPAAKNGLARGDEILAIDERPTAKMTMDDVLVAMRGPAGDAVRLKILPAGKAEPKSLELVRENITVESVLGDIRGAEGRWQFRLSADPRVAHVRIRSFGDLTAQEVELALSQLVMEGVEAIVLDVRDNAGGTLDAAVDVCSLILPPGSLIVETRGRDGEAVDRRVTGGLARPIDLPLAVLINQNSASAAEIVAAALQDHARAIVVGQRTYGKGTVQQLIPLQAGKSTLKLTWAGFWRPSGRNIHRLQSSAADAVWGVHPDDGYSVILPADEYAIYEKYRSDRDLTGIDAMDEPDDSSAAKEPTVPADFVDRQLARAVEALRVKLDNGVR
jgi:carboxyl-terminal processing protease